MAKGVMYIDGHRVAFDGEKNVLAVIRKAGIEMPTLCYYSELSVYGACRMCMVEDEKTGKLDASCSMEPRDGMRIRTNTARLLKHRRMILELLLSSHCRDCTVCEKSGDCRLQELALRFGVRRVRFDDTRRQQELDDSTGAVVRDPNKCILCGDCIRVCEEMQGMSIINFAHRGSDLQVMPAFDKKLAATECVGCGQCAAACPTGAITIYNQIGEAWRALHDPQKRVIVQIAPAVRVAVGEAFGLPAGENAMDYLVAALELMGAEEVFDTNLAADLTVMEETAEFMDRLQNGGKLPLFTSCCPAWIRYVEQRAPQFLPYVSTCKSPMEMFAAMLKDEYREMDAKDGRTTYHIAIMPCTAKKQEAKRNEYLQDGMPDVNLVLTTQEIINMIKESGIRFNELEKIAPDLPYGLGTGSGAIFGVTGGVSEAVLRRAAHEKNQNARHEIRFSGIRGNDGIREVTIPYGDDGELRLCVVNGLANAKKVLEDVEAGRVNYHIVEVMTCKGGCIGGGGQPHGSLDAKARRAEGLYDIDRSALIKFSENNPVVQRLYEGRLKGRTHELFHVKRVDK